MSGRRANTVAQIKVALWTLVAGAITLYGFGLVIGGYSLADTWWMALAVAALAVALALHSLRVSRALADHRHDELARDVHKMRERRGF